MWPPPVPGRGRVQRTGSAGQQLAGLGAGGQGGAVRATPWVSGSGPTRRWTGPPPWAATASGSAWSGPGSSRATGTGPGGAGPVRRDHRAVSTRPPAPGDPPPLHPPGVAGGGLLAAARRARRFRQWAEVVVDGLGPSVRHWVTLNEINVLALSWPLGHVPAPAGPWPSPTPRWPSTTCSPRTWPAYEVIHAGRPDAVVTTNNCCLDVYEFDRMLTDVLWPGSMGVGPRRPRRVDRRAQSAHYRCCRAGAWPSSCFGGARRVAVWPARSPAPGRGDRAGGRCPGGPSRPSTPAPTPDPRRARPGLLRPGWSADTSGCPAIARPAGARRAAPRAVGRRARPGRADPLARRPARPGPGLPLWVVENGLCNRVRNGRPSRGSTDGTARATCGRTSPPWWRPSTPGCRSTGYWHWSLVDNYEWGSYEPRFGLFGVDRDRGDHGLRWLETDSLGGDAAGPTGTSSPASGPATAPSSAAG